MHRVIKLTLNILAALTLLVSLVWLVTAPGFEPLLTLLGALGTFLVSFLIKAEIATTFDMPVLSGSPPPTAAPLAIPARWWTSLGRSRSLPT